MAIDLERLGHFEYGPPLVIFALERESVPFRRIVRDSEAMQVVVSGVGRKAAFDIACRALADAKGCPRLVISAGYCGALSPDLHVGDVVAASGIIEPSGQCWRCATTTGIRVGRLLTVSELIAAPHQKRSLHEDYEADIVDMESAGVAEACLHIRGVSFIAVRAVSDTAATALSPELVRVLSGGNVSIWKAMKALARKPALLGEFRRLARDTRLAARNLADALMALISSPPHSPVSAAPPSPS